MPTDNYISRRKALAATSGIGGSLLAIPGVGAADPDEDAATDSNKELKYSEEDIKRSLEKTPLAVTSEKKVARKREKT